jgi:uncharacterized membrane protein YhaH (DUF805 family)
MRPATASDLFFFFFRPVGRVGRAEYALAVGMIVSIEFAALVYFYGHPDANPGVAFLVALLGLPLFVAELVVVAKRCHDVGLPGLFVVLIFVPLLGLGWLLLLAVMPGSPGVNAYGAPPGRDPD